METLLRDTFTFADPELSIRNLESIKDFMYRKSNGNVYLAAFRRDVSKEIAIPALDFLAKELFAYLNNTTIETQSSFDAWHDDVCQRFLEVLNSTSPRIKAYGKAQKALNMAMKYAYCCHDAKLTFPYKKFDYAHMALDGYTYIEKIENYPLAFCRDIVFPRLYGCHPDGRKKSWSHLTRTDYLATVTNIRDFIGAYPHTFNDYLTACHAEGLLTSIPLFKAGSRALTPFEAEFFIWEICKNNCPAVIAALF